MRAAETTDLDLIRFLIHKGAHIDAQSARIPRLCCLISEELD